MGVVVVPDLPGDVLDAILARLPLRDAARASVLSTTWGAAWRNLSDLDLPSASLELFGTTRAAIDAVLQQHAGRPVRRARFVVADAHLPAVDGWTTALAQDPGGRLQSLDLTFCMCVGVNRNPSFPVFFAACAGLKHLTLSCCTLPDAPASFAGFPRLATLCLAHVGVRKGGDLEAIISMSPELEALLLGNVYVVVNGDAVARHELRMASPSLRFLKICGQGNIDWVGGPASCCLPRMAHAEFTEARPDTVASLLRGMAASVENLNYHHSFLRNALLKGLPSSYRNLKRLRVLVNFNYALEISSTMHFLRSAPNLTHLVVSDITDETEEFPYHWQLESYEICPSLRFLHIFRMIPLCNELDFMRLVLSRARMLQVVEVHIPRRVANRQIEEEICGYDRASSDAQICFS